jgi:hypothetical protein
MRTRRRQQDNQPGAAHPGRRRSRGVFWHWLYLASPAGQLSSHPAAGVLCVIGLVSALVGFVHWCSGFAIWQGFAGVAAVLWLNALIGAAIEVFYDERESHPCYEKENRTDDSIPTSDKHPLPSREAPWYDPPGGARSANSSHHARVLSNLTAHILGR